MRTTAISVLLLTLLLSDEARAQAPHVPAAVAPHALRSTALSDAAFAFVRGEDKHRFWLSREQVAKPAIVGQRRLVGSDSAFAPIATKTLPAALRQLDGQVMRLFTSRGESCEVTLRSWGIFAEFNPVPEGEDGEPDPVELARRAYAEDQSAVLHYAVDITSATEKCADALWARLGSLPDVPSFPVEQLKGRAREALRAPLRKTTAYKEAQQRYRAEHKGSWDRHRETSLTVFSAMLGETRHWVGNLHHFDGCESFAGDAIGFFWRGEDGYREQPNERSVTFEPVQAIDLNGDGFPEWLSQYQLVSWDGEQMNVLRDVEPQTWWCPC